VYRTLVLVVSVDGLQVVLEGVWHLEVGGAEGALDAHRVHLPVLGKKIHAAKTLAALQTLALLLVQTQRMHVADRPETVTAPII
jgi:hypothetical protein